MSRASACPELDCVRTLLPRRIIAAAEDRARSIGLGADRVLICADAITEEAYLTALATSLGTTYEPLDTFFRSDCPLDDTQLIHAAKNGLLPLDIHGHVVWIVAPRCQTARNLADPHHPASRLLRTFRLTSSERLWRFVARYTKSTLGRQAADGLRCAQPLFSNGSLSYVRTTAAVTLAVLAVAVLALIRTATIKTFAALLSAVFLAAAALRLSSALHTPRRPNRPHRTRDIELPIYTIICALYREERIVGDLVSAIRALDYPGIMAQTPQADRSAPLT